MALSEREQKLLEELERGLYADDPKLAKVTQPRLVSNSAARLIGGALLAVIGISLLVFSVMIQNPVFGVISFALMLLGAMIASATARAADISRGGAKNSGPAGGAKPGQTDKKPRSASFFEDRWDRRQSD